MTKASSKSQQESADKFDETKSREEEWAIAGKRVDKKASEEEDNEDG